jgi:hypothetical protein
MGFSFNWSVRSEQEDGIYESYDTDGQCLRWSEILQGSELLEDLGVDD